MFRASRIRLPLVLLVVVLAASLSGMVGVQAQGDERSKIKVGGNQKPLDLIKQLREQDLVPGGGELTMQVPRSILRVRQEGFSALRLGRGAKYRDFVLQFEMRATSLDGETNGCGMVFRSVQEKIGANDDWSYVMLTRDRRVILIQNDSGEELVSFDQSLDEIDGVDASDYDLSPEQLHILTLIAIEDRVMLFLNGLEIIEETTAKSVRGAFGAIVFNEEGNNTNSECRYSNIWVWSYDN